MAKVESGVFPCYENQFAVGKAGTESAKIATGDLTDEGEVQTPATT